MNKHDDNKRNVTFNIATYVAGILCIVSALIVAVFCFLSATGLFHPKKQTIFVSTQTVEYTYDPAGHQVSPPFVSYGELLPGHTIAATHLDINYYTGIYDNAPEFAIYDSNGSDVTNMYQIETRYGKMIINGMPLCLYSNSLTKQYDGTPLVSGEITVSGGTLLDGHKITSQSTSLTLPGTTEISPLYVITDADGNDVTDIYSITEQLGTLTVTPLPLKITTASATKTYDGAPLSKDSFQHVGGKLLDGHTLNVKCTTQITAPGTHINDFSASIYDAQGNDVSYLYDVTADYGTLTVNPIKLYLTTPSQSKQYDGTPLKNNGWTLTAGKLADGESINVIDAASITAVGSTPNKLNFIILDKNGGDVTSRYEIVQTSGILKVTPRAITIRTGSASKKYDGTALDCNEYWITKGSICDGEDIAISFVSLTNIGYTQNYPLYLSITYTNDDGTKTETSNNYLITYDYGTLTITAE